MFLLQSYLTPKMQAMELFVPDEVDLRILRHLIEDSSLSHKEIGLLVHLTGQAVGARVRKMEDAGIIEGYTIRWSPEKMKQTIHAFITVPYINKHG